MSFQFHREPSWAQDLTDNDIGCSVSSHRDPQTDTEFSIPVCLPLRKRTSSANSLPCLWTRKTTASSTRRKQVGHFIFSTRPEPTPLPATYPFFQSLKWFQLTVSGPVQLVHCWYVFQCTLARQIADQSRLHLLLNLHPQPFSHHAANIFWKLIGWK